MVANSLPNPQVHVSAWRGGRYDLKPLYLAEGGECYIRKHGSTERYGPLEIRQLQVWRFFRFR